MPKRETVAVSGSNVTCIFFQLMLLVQSEALDVLSEPLVRGAYVDVLKLRKHNCQFLIR